MKKWSVSTGSMRGCRVDAPTPMMAAALALAKKKPRSIGQIIECKPIPCKSEDDIFYVDTMRAFDLAGLKITPPRED